MFVIELVYKADLKEIDAHMTAHVKFLKKYYADGTFLVSGRKIPREGGIILATGKTRQQIEALIQEDPFHQARARRLPRHRVPRQSARGRHAKKNRGVSHHAGNRRIR